jgi:hypothetical protein
MVKIQVSSGRVSRGVVKLGEVEDEDEDEEDLGALGGLE